MKRIKYLIPGFIFALSACHTSDDNKDTINTDTVASMKLATDSNVISAAIDSNNNIQNTTSWKGNYKAVLPCMDCAGIVTEITLNSDNTYTISTQYLGKKDSRVTTNNGKVDWINDSTIQLKGITDAPSKYLITQNEIVQLDLNGKQIEGELANRYIFKKAH